MSSPPYLDILPPRYDPEYVSAGLPPLRCAPTFPHPDTGRYPHTHITDDRILTLCLKLIPPVIWMKGPRGETPYINNHPVDCVRCLDAAGIGNKTPR